MKKIIALMLVACLFFFGCIEQPVQPQENVSVNVSVQPAAPSDIHSTTAMLDGATLKFDLTDYSFEDNSNPFSDGAGGDLGKTSTAYIRINESDLIILAQNEHCGIEEHQSIWITPMISKGKGVIFEAAYLAEFEGKSTCNKPLVRLLGKEYEVIEFKAPSLASGKLVRGGSIRLQELNTSSIITLKDGTGFNKDSRWPVALGWEEGMLRKIIIYMEGYFFDIEDEQGVPLFNAGNRFMASFSDLNTKPRFELNTGMDEVFEEPPEEKGTADASPAIPHPINETSIVEDRDVFRNYSMDISEDVDHLFVSFTPSIPEYQSPWDEYMEDDDDRSDRHNIILNISGNNWAIAKLNRTTLILGKEKSELFLNPFSNPVTKERCDFNGSNPSIYVSDMRFGFGDIDFGREIRVVFCQFLTNDSCSGGFSMAEGETLKIGNEYLHVWQFASGYVFCCSWAQVSVFTDIIELNSSYLKFEDSNRTALKSITIPKSDPAYAKLIATS